MIISLPLYSTHHPASSKRTRRSSYLDKPSQKFKQAANFGKFLLRRTATLVNHGGERSPDTTEASAEVATTHHSRPLCGPVLSPRCRVLNDACVLRTADASSEGASDTSVGTEDNMSEAATLQPRKMTRVSGHQHSSSDYKEISTSVNPMHHALASRTGSFEMTATGATATSTTPPGIPRPAHAAAPAHTSSLHHHARMLVAPALEPMSPFSTCSSETPEGNRYECQGAGQESLSAAVDRLSQALQMSCSTSDSSCLDSADPPIIPPTASVRAAYSYRVPGIAEGWRGVRSAAGAATAAPPTGTT